MMATVRSPWQGSRPVGGHQPVGGFGYRPPHSNSGEPQAFRDGRRNAPDTNPVSTRVRLAKVDRVESKAHRKFSRDASKHHGSECTCIIHGMIK